jgi:hypothetical protein
VVWLAHYTGSGIDGVLDLDEEEFWSYFDASFEVYQQQLKIERQAPQEVILTGIKK